MSEEFVVCLKAVKDFLHDTSGEDIISRLKFVTESMQLRDKKAILDLALRDRMLSLLGENANDKVRALLKITADAAVADLCSAATPFLLFADLFNTKLISDAEDNFQFMEKTVTALKDVSLFGPGRNVLLRMCNDLLRRLSKSQNTVFCGRIQLFLTRLFPLDEKSGLNLMSNFNTEKETTTTTSQTEEAEYGEAASTKVNSKLFHRFWSLQKYLKNPILCYTKDGWNEFVEYAECVVETFSSIRLTEGNSERRWRGQKFTMYLTSEKLLDLQLLDVNFRKYILVQLLIIFQYLTADVKFKTATQTLDDSQTKWITTQRDSIAKLLGGSSPSQQETSSISSTSYGVIEHILNRENHWNRWKNEGCPSFIKHPEKSVLVPKKRRTNPLVDRSGNKLYRFGNRDLDKLWSICPDNLEACRDKKRLFRPDLYTYFQDAILEMDPNENVTEEYKSINREEWTWRSMRLLSRNVSYFYTNWNPPGRSIKAYLTIILNDKLRADDDKKSSNGDETPKLVASAPCSEGNTPVKNAVQPVTGSAPSPTSTKSTAKRLSTASSSVPRSRSSRSRSPIRPLETSILDTSTDIPVVSSTTHVASTIASRQHLSDDTDGEADEDLEDDEDEEMEAGVGGKDDGEAIQMSN